ncbi:SGNH/GDSL hydrolase family protein [Rhodococcus sp. NPDC004095]
MRAKAVPAPLFRFVSFSVAAMLSFVAVCAVGVPEATAAEPTYYVSLGDSLAAGYQPDTRKDEPVSYTDDLFATLRASDPNLQHIRLGCSGESTATMINGGRCTYDGATSQLDAATKFITAHRGQVRYVTEDLGANDVYPCIRGGGSGSPGSSGVPDVGCVANALATIGTNLATINRQLRAAGGEGPAYVGMTYYNPTLASWPTGTTGQAVAVATTGADNVLGSTIVTANSGAGWKTADVAAAFSTNDFGNPVAVPGLGTQPHNVAQVCLWTWMCTGYKDIHANPAGHRAIAETFLPILTGASAR